jgi:hypothetical protein
LRSPEIEMLRTVAQRGGTGIPVAVSARLRAVAQSLWRRELVQVWYRQSVTGSLDGPFLSLTIAGFRLAQSLPSGSSTSNGASARGRSAWKSWPERM